MTKDLEVLFMTLPITLQVNPSYVFKNFYVLLLRVFFCHLVFKGILSKSFTKLFESSDVSSS